MLVLKGLERELTQILFSKKSIDFSEFSWFFTGLSRSSDNTEVSFPFSIFSYSNRIFSVVNSSGKIKSISIGYFIHLL